MDVLQEVSDDPEIVGKATVIPNRIIHNGRPLNFIRNRIRSSNDDPEVATTRNSQPNSHSPSGTLSPYSNVAVNVKQIIDGLEVE